MRIQILILGFKGLIEPPVTRWFKSILTRTQRVMSSILTWSSELFLSFLVLEISFSRLITVKNYCT